MIHETTMCYFLTLSIHGESTPTVPEKFRRHISFHEQHNPSIAQLNPEATTSFVVVSGQCSCELYRHPGESDADDSRIIRKYQDRGWSQERIQRVLGERREPKNRFEGFREDIIELIDGLACQYGDVRVSIHFYHGGIDTETFQLIDKGIASRDQFGREATQIESDTTFLVAR